MEREHLVTCSVCLGKGWRRGLLCTVCGGTGRLDRRGRPAGAPKERPQ
ncbi:MAG: hypothetical protein AB1578_23175 [Thermodesulfobacteriota bacterium]